MFLKLHAKNFEKFLIFFACIFKKIIKISNFYIILIFIQKLNKCDTFFSKIRNLFILNKRETKNNT